MKPTDEQVRILQKYLHSVLTYREAYDELYDHIFTALEHQPENIPFQDAINNIIRNDFGDPKNLLKVEKGIKSGIVNDALRKYFAYLSNCFKFPGIVYTIIGVLVAYYFFSNAKLSPVGLSVVFALVVMAPSVIWGMRLFNTGYMLDTTRKSAKDKLFETFTGVPIRVALIPIIFVRLTDYQLWQNNSNYWLSVLLMTGVLYNVALYQLYRDEFKSVQSK